MRDQPRIAVVGSTMIDLIASTARVPHAGETIQGDDFQLGFGGKGANQAVMARLLGAEVTMVNALGDDVFGDMTIHNFEVFGIDTMFPRARAGLEWRRPELGWSDEAEIYRSGAERGRPNPTDHPLT